MEYATITNDEEQNRAVAAVYFKENAKSLIIIRWAGEAEGLVETFGKIPELVLKSRPGMNNVCTVTHMTPVRRHGSESN